MWDDPTHAGKISREHGSIMGKIKEVNAFEQELFEHIDMIKLAREENDAELESVGLVFSLSRHVFRSFRALHYLYYGREIIQTGLLLFLMVFIVLSPFI